jgi:hypothetical protein
MNISCREDFEIVQSCVKGWVRVDVYLSGYGRFIRIGSGGIEIKLMESDGEKIIIGVDMV